jgi:hypothetical protein
MNNSYPEDFIAQVLDIPKVFGIRINPGLSYLLLNHIETGIRS